MNAPRATLTALTALTLLAALALPTPAASQLVKIKNAGDALVFYPTVEVRELSLTVTGPCNFEFRTRSKEGKIVFELSDEAFDGAYSFTVDAVPQIDRQIRKILTEARRTGENGRVRELCRDGKLPTGPTSQAGGFSIVERRIVLDTTPETERDKRDEGKRAAERAQPDTLLGDQLASTSLAVDRDPISGEFQLASADTATADPAECTWARIKPNSGLSGR